MRLNHCLPATSPTRLIGYPDSRHCYCHAGCDHVRHRTSNIGVPSRATTLLTGRECCRDAVQPGQEYRLTLLYHDCYCNCCWSRRDFFFSVCFIMFMVEANAVAKRKTVMRGDEINRGTRQTTITFKKHRWRQQNARQTPPRGKS